MNDYQRTLWDEFTRSEKEGNSAVYAVFERYLNAGERDRERLIDITAVLQRKMEDAFWSDMEEPSIYFMMYDMMIQHAQKHLEQDDYHVFCQSVYETGSRRWIREVFL